MATENGSFQEVKLVLFAVVQGINTLLDDRKNVSNTGSKSWEKNQVPLKRN
jgi:hypothetical protein